MEYIDQIKVQNPNTQFLSCWDFDGTLIKGDIGEGLYTEGKHEYCGLVEEAIIHGFIPRYSNHHGLQQFWQKYKDLAKEHSLLKAYKFLVDCIYTIPRTRRDEFKELCIRLVDEHISKYFYSQTRALMASFNNKKIIPIIISASPQILIDSVIHHFPVDPQFAFGVSDPKENKQIFNYGEGKVARIDAVSKLLKEKLNTNIVAIFAAGDSWANDGAMMQRVCKNGGLSLCINPYSSPKWVTDFNIYCTQVK